MVTKTQTLPAQPLVYRVWQFVQALTARRLRPAEWQAVAAILSPAQRALFCQMHTRDQRHSLQVMQTLQAAGETQPDLLAAALLHDVGKARHRLRLWESPIVVLVRAWRPAVARRWGKGPMSSWRRPFVVYEQHPTWGAEMAAAAHSSPDTVWLIRWHQGQPDRVEAGTAARLALLEALQRADSAN